MTRPGNSPPAAKSWRHIHYSSFDGLRLHVRHYGRPNPDTRPAVCLAGLTRNSRDFHYLAEHLAHNSEAPREVFALDYRGRGLSDYDPDWRNYSPFIELLDTLDFMATANLHDAAVIGTSRGGIIAMMMAVLRPGMIGAAVLNDIGPEIGTAGLARIMGYAGKIPVPSDWNEAVALVRQINERFFTDMSPEDWDALARMSFNESEGGQPTASYDKQIAKALSQIDISKRIPDMWAHFDALCHVPLMILRGENTDLLSADTFEAMKQRHPDATAVTVPAQGHPVLFLDRSSIRQVAAFLAAADPRRERYRPISYELYPVA